MSVLRVHRHKRDFTITVNATPRDRRLSARARGVLWFLLSQRDGYPVNAEKLSTEEFPEGRDAIEKAIRELLKAGYLRRHREQDPKGHWITYTDVYETPELAVEESPTDDGFSGLGDDATDNGFSGLGPTTGFQGSDSAAGQGTNAQVVPGPGLPSVGKPGPKEEGRTPEGQEVPPTGSPDGLGNPSIPGLDLPEGSPSSRGSPPSPHGGAPPPPSTSQNGHKPKPGQKTSDSPNGGVLMGEYLAACKTRPPAKYVGHLSREVKALVEEGIHPDHIRAGLAIVRQRGLDPSRLPSAVAQAMNADGRPAGRDPAAPVDPEEERRRALEFVEREEARLREARFPSHNPEQGAAT